MTEDTVRPAGAPALSPTLPAARWSLVLPVKRLALAKSRLDGFAGARRPDLALAFALDTVAAALACPAVARVLVVTRDEVAAARLAALGALVVDDEPLDPADAGAGAGGHGGYGGYGGHEALNSALAHGAVRARRHAPDAPVATLSADLPALRPAELGRVLAAVPATGRAFLADAPGTGTTLLACRPGAPLRPAFGPGSRSRHAADGAHELGCGDVPSVRRDVDTAADLAEALTLGVGPQTAAVAAALV
ncbi:2-phospho-L-lactate guanylyltransferase [Kitasatospora camelliae]|uniref:Phosphoenolpyruvate guanylyltransferase n=1 Tax=Kitasatospora camelliae TaxID=3156397 RepID=A0AAU8JYR0_9ACTN